MNFLHELHNMGVTWAIRPAVAKVHPTSLHDRLCQQVTVYFPEGEPVVKNFAANGGEANSAHLLIQTIRSDVRVKGLMRRWFDSRGNVPVAMYEGLIEHEMVAELVHTGLRKLADSKQSSICWNALHQMRREDRGAFWAMLTKALVDSFEARKGKAQPTRRQVAADVRRAVLDHFKDMSYGYIESESGRMVERRADERFALISMHCACELTEMDEWLWGWLGYALKDVERMDADEPVDPEVPAC